MSRTFTMPDQLAFARLSGDYNPIHIDPVAARRLLFGRPVAHGIHVLLWAIDSLLGQLEHRDGLKVPMGLTSLRASFRGPILVDDPVDLLITPGKGGRWKLDLSGNRASVVLSLVSAESGVSPFPLSPLNPEKLSCRELKAEDLPNAQGRLPLCLEQHLAAKLFPAASRLLRSDHLATLLASSRLVGMELPGLHSLYTGLDLEARSADGNEAAFAFATESYDRRFSMLDIKVKAPTLSGRIMAALRPSPTLQASIADLGRLVQPGEFAGQRALVIGGSRGLGETAVKELSAGGAEVRFTYHRGVDEARQIADEIVSNGGSAAYYAFDVSGDASRLPALLDGWHPTALYYFATPHIGSSDPGRFSAETFRVFSGCYVRDFLAVFHTISKYSPDLVSVFYPSSCTVDEMPPNLIEYFTAKAAGETLCRFLEGEYPRVSFLVPRLPRLATDQTAGLLPVETAGPEVCMLSMLRRMNDPLISKVPAEKA